MSDALLEVRGLVKAFGAVLACDGVNLSIAEGEVHAVIGPNGAGKTTMIGQLAGDLRPDAGSIRFDGEDITRLPTYARSARGLARSFQITTIFPRFSVLENVALAVQAHSGHSFRFWRPTAGDILLEKPAMAVLDRLGLAERSALPAAALSHGEQRQLEIAIALATEPRLLLLDEPTAGMGLEESARMIRLLASLKPEVSILLIEHDMDVVFTLADRITVLVYGRVLASGRPEAIRMNEEVRRAYLGDGGS